MVANIPEEYGALGSLCKPVTVSERRCIFRRPPSVEMTALVSSQAGPAPAAVLAISRLVVQSAGSYRQALHQVRGAPANRRVALQCELFQEFLMAEDRVRRSAGFKRPDKTELLLGFHCLSPRPMILTRGMRGYCRSVTRAALSSGCVFDHCIEACDAMYGTAERGADLEDGGLSYGTLVPAPRSCIAIRKSELY